EPGRNIDSKAVAEAKTARLIPNLVVTAGRAEDGCMIAGNGIHVHLDFNAHFTTCREQRCFAPPRKAKLQIKVMSTILVRQPSQGGSDGKNQGIRVGMSRCADRGCVHMSVEWAGAA